MTHHERIARIFAGQETDRPGFWLGQPHADSTPAILRHFGVADMEQVRQIVDDDCRWITAADWAYRHPQGRPAFDVMYGLGPKRSHGQPGCFAAYEDPAAVEKYPWPDAQHVDMNIVRESAKGKEEYWRFGGAWCSFFHIAADFFGMENYFLKMYTHPAVVHAVTRRLLDFFLAANERMFSEGPELFDIFFFGNDFGTQRDTLLSPEMFKEFVLPYFRELIAQAKRYGKLVQLHSCGAIARVIPLLIDAGIDALHPLQARAEGMQAEVLAREYKGKIVFVGGVDTQDLLWRGTPREIHAEVARLRRIFGPRWIISPSHECILPEVPMQNIVALCEAATGRKL